MTPAEFMAEYVRPAIALWEAEPTSTLKAVCAISQLDIFAEVVALERAGGHLPRGAGALRNELGEREPAIARIRDAHDSHKHGRLGRPTAEHVTEGQRPYRSAGGASFIGHAFIGHMFLGRPDTSLLMDDGTPVPVGQMLREAMEAWDRELPRLGIPI